MGRIVRQGKNLIEEFYPSENEIADKFEKHLHNLIAEQNLKTTINMPVNMLHGKSIRAIYRLDTQLHLNQVKNWRNSWEYHGRKNSVSCMLVYAPIKLFNCFAQNAAGQAFCLS